MIGVHYLSVPMKLQRPSARMLIARCRLLILPVVFQATALNGFRINA